jgi:hypothetical protein
MEKPYHKNGGGEMKHTPTTKYHKIMQQERIERLSETNDDLLETLKGTMSALQRVLDKYNPDDIEYEWVGNANEAIIHAEGKTNQRNMIDLAIAMNTNQKGEGQ